jgi:hypothetical protein
MRIEAKMTNLSIQPKGDYAPCAVFFADSDCVEYVKRDVFCIYDRVDEYLTLIYDETGHSLIGFKVKGFKHLFDTKLKNLFRLKDYQFVDFVGIIERLCEEIGDSLFADEPRTLAYKAAMNLAANDNVKFYSADYALAA